MRHRYKGLQRYSLPFKVLGVGTLDSLISLSELISQLFSAGEQGGIYIPNPIVNGVQSLFQDSAGTAAVTADGDPVGLMVDQSPNNKNASQSVSAERPVYTLANGLDFLLFDAVSDRLLFPFIAGDADNFVFSIAVTPEVSSDNNPRYFGLVGTGINLQCGYVNNGTVFTRVGSVAQTTVSSITLGNTYVISHIRQGGVSSIRINGTVFSLGGSGPSANSMLSNTGVLGAGYQPNEYKLKGKIHAALFRYGSITEGQLSDIDTYFASVAGVTL